MTGKFKYALAGCGLLLAGSAFANLEEHWKDKDANNDGKVSRAEFITAAEENFSKMDTNNDSVLSENEFRNYKEHMKDRRKDKEG